MRDLRMAEEREKALGMDRAKRKELQSCLNEAGFDPGTPDGMFGPRSRAAVRAWQASQGLRDIEAAGYFGQGDADALLKDCRSDAPEPVCTGQAGQGYWMEVSNHAGCYIWNPNPQPDKTVEWTGGCVDGKISGHGRDTWRFKKDGAWVSSGNEGPARAGKGIDGHHVRYTCTKSAWRCASSHRVD